LPKKPVVKRFVDLLSDELLRKWRREAIEQILQKEFADFAGSTLHLAWEEEEGAERRG